MVDCDKILKELAEKENWTKEQEGEFLRQAELIKKQRDATARIEPGADIAEQLAQKWAEREKLAAWQRKLNTARNLRAQASLVNYCLTHFKGKEGEGLYARMVGSKYLREGGRDSVDARGRASACIPSIAASLVIFGNTYGRALFGVISGMVYGLAFA